MKNKQITIIDVAKEAGVSIATVSNVLNRRNVPLTEETIRKVEEAVGKLGYRRNVMAASLSRKRTFELGLIIPSFGGYFGDFAHVMQDTVHRLGYHLSVFSSSHNPDLEQRHLETLLQRRVDGLFCHGLAMTPELTRTIVGEGTPLVLFNAWGWPEDVALGAVNLDFVEGVAEVVRHLAGQGCQSLFYVGRQGARATDAERRKGFYRGIDELRSNGAAVKQHGIVEIVENDWETAADHLIEAASGAYPAGVLAFDDFNAFALVSALRARGISVPEQFKVSGINNQAVAKYNEPPLTSLDIPLHAQVRHAVHLLLEHLGETSKLESIPLEEYEGCRKENRSGLEVHIPLKLIARKSTE